jgi:peptidoglycan/LPS O-acetylase OafA/YrhL
LNLPESQVVTGNTTQTRPENRAFYPALDGLRAVAFLMVFIQHYNIIPWGWTGVNIFFVLSGFLITGILYDSRNDPHRARNFYVRRSLRIFPLYYGIFLLLLVLSPLCHWMWSWLWLAWPLYLANFLRFVSPQMLVTGSAVQLAGNGWLASAYLPKDPLYLGHFWSLCVEEQFYLCWPWVVFQVRSRRALLWICGSAVVLVPLLRVVAQMTAPAWMQDQELLYRATPFQLDSLLLGGFIALLWRGADRERLLLAGRAVALACVVAAGVYLARTVHLSDPFWREDYAYPAWKLTGGLSFVDVFSAAVILCCLSPRGWLARLLSLPPLRWLGRISYGAYVFHDILHVGYVDFIDHLKARSAWVASHDLRCLLAVSFGGTILLSWLSFRFFESRFLNLKERWTIF